MKDVLHSALDNSKPLSLRRYMLTMSRHTRISILHLLISGFAESAPSGFVSGFAESPSSDGVPLPPVGK